MGAAEAGLRIVSQKQVLIEYVHFNYIVLYIIENTHLFLQNTMIFKYVSQVRRWLML